MDEIALVSDDEVSSMILALIEKQKMISEGAGAVAAVMAGKFDLRGKRVVAVVSGGNVTGVHYEKSNTESINGCFLRIEMETRDSDHVNLITHFLCAEGFKLV